ncbi:DMT family transporter [Patescibacteria group bacterium]
MKIKGLKFAFLTAFVSGVSIFINGLLVTGFNPIAFSLFRNLLVGIILTIAVISTGRLSKINKLSKSDKFKLIGIGVIGGGVPFGLFFFGLSRIGGVNANLINKSLFLWVAMFAIIKLKEKLNWLSIIGYGMIFFSLFGGVNLSDDQVGLAAVLGATIFWAYEHVLAKKILKKANPIDISWARIVGGLPILGIFYLLSLGGDISSFTSMFYPAMISAIFLITYMFFWYTAIKFAPVTIVSSVLVLAPIITILLNASLLGKSMSAIRPGVFVLLISGVILISIKYLKLKPKKVT